MIDTHCHLNFPGLSGELEAVLARAKAAGVDRVIIPGVDAESTQSAVALADSHPGVLFAAAGVHPDAAHQYDRAVFRAAADRSPHLVAIGEVGFDFYHPENPSREQQETVFRDMIALAKERDLPLIIHSREAFADTYRVLKEEAAGRKVVMHCFYGSPEEAAAWLDLGFTLSLTGIITYKKNGDVREMVKTLPLDRIMLETDGPYLAPEGYRGQTCEPWHVSKVAQCVADLHGKPVAEIDRITTKTAEAFFSL